MQFLGGSKQFTLLTNEAQKLCAPQAGVQLFYPD